MVNQQVAIPPREAAWTHRGLRCGRGRPDFVSNQRILTSLLWVFPGQYGEPAGGHPPLEAARVHRRLRRGRARVHPGAADAAVPRGAHGPAGTYRVLSVAFPVPTTWWSC